MDLRRLRPGELLAAAGGIALLALTVVAWYDRPGGGSASAWAAFTVLDVALALAGLAGVLLAVLNAARRTPALPVFAEVWTTALAGLVALAVFYRLVDKPGGYDAVAPGGYLGLGATLLIAAGAFRSLRDEAPRGTPAPEVELRPAPSGAAQSGTVG
jgi:hypothetical protein